MADSSTNPSTKTNPWLGFALLAPLTIVLWLLSRSGLDGAARGIVILGVALIQAALALRLLLGVQRLHALFKGLLLLIAVFVFLLLLMPTLQLFEGPGRSAEGNSISGPATEEGMAAEKTEEVVP